MFGLGVMMPPMLSMDQDRDGWFESEATSTVEPHTHVDYGSGSMILAGVSNLGDAHALSDYFLI